jgi:transcription antitermination protein NusB
MSQEHATPPIRQRRRARALALQTLYETDLTGHRAGDVLQRLTEQLHANPAAFDYARELVAGVISHIDEIDRSINRHTTAWKADQMPGVDRNLLRIGIFEAIYNSTTIPVAVAIDEAVELAKLYGTESSSRLIHGILGSVVAAGATGPLNPDEGSNSPTPPGRASEATVSDTDNS